jgi:mRNA interferase RelE/StbE
VYQISYRKSALKSLRKAPVKTQARVVAEPEAIASRPSAYRGDWKPLTGTAYWRLRVGGWRAICDIQQERLVILVLEFGPRGDVHQ